MKKSFIAKMSVLLASIMLVCVALTGCSENDEKVENDTTPKDYIIQYSDDAGVHTFTVTEGLPYSLESIPYRYGYEFLGLFDAQTGGTQYVDAKGASLSPYRDKESMVLFPQFKPIDYTVILDYGNAVVTGERSLTVAYNESIPELPKNLTLEHNEFTGWYTEADGKGTQVADPYGNLPVVSVLNEENFKLDESKRVYLYAGFEPEKYTVTFIFDDNMPSEEMEVPYNTPISQIVPTTRNHLNEVPLTWSKSRNGEVYYGNVTDDLVLYAKEWAPIIELNGNGVEVSPIVARAGSTISLPTPTKPLAKFLRWEDENGEEYKATKMPDKSITLNAIWQGKIEFDENGGSEVDDISKPAGESIILPTPMQDGCIFAGWYTTEKEQYTQTEMPAEGIVLKAGWYKEKIATVIQCTGDSRLGGYDNKSIIMQNDLTIDLSNLLPTDFEGNVSIEAHFKAYFSGDPLGSSKLMTLYLYSQNTVSDNYLLVSKSYTIRQNPETFGYSLATNLKGTHLYSAIKVSDSYGYAYITDYYLDITYLDTANLYL